MPISGPSRANLHHLAGLGLCQGELMRTLLSSLNEMKQTKKLIQLGKPAAFQSGFTICLEIVFKWSDMIIFLLYKCLLWFRHSLCVRYKITWQGKIKWCYLFNKRVMVMLVSATMMEQPISAIQKIISNVINSSPPDAFGRGPWWDDVTRSRHCYVFLSMAHYQHYEHFLKEECPLIFLRTFWYALGKDLHSVLSCSDKEKHQQVQQLLWLTCTISAPGGTPMCP